MRSQTRNDPGRSTSPAPRPTWSSSSWPRSEDEPKFLADWDAFFYGGDRRQEGSRDARLLQLLSGREGQDGAIVVARFTDPTGKLKDGSLQPYMVTTPPSSNRRVVWIGSGETWRLRQFKVPYHERFWMKLLRYAGSNNMSRVSKRIRLYMGSTHVANKPIEFEGKFDGKDGEPLGRDRRPPEVKLTPPPGVPDSVRRSRSR